jgi:hypothetical protein
MAEDLNAMAFLVERFFGRKPEDAELVAMSAETQRDATWIASHPYGRDGGLFYAEPSGFDAWMKREAGK